MTYVTKRKAFCVEGEIEMMRMKMCGASALPIKRIL